MKRNAEIGFLTKPSTINAATSANPDVPLPWAKWLVIMSRLWFSVWRVNYGKRMGLHENRPP
jgi:hypothetical protein